MTPTERIVSILKALDEKESELLGMELEKRMHMFSSQVMTRWMEKYPEVDIGQALKDAEQQSIIHWDQDRTMVGLK